MIVVKVELHSAITGKVTEIGQMVIDNLGTGTPSSGNYRARVARRGADFMKMVRGNSKPVREGEVNDYPRLTATVWKLVYRSLASCYPEEVKRQQRHDNSQ